MIQLTGVTKTYDLGSRKLDAIKEIDLRIDRGEFVTVMGPSGSGKSTLLAILGILDSPTRGTYSIEENEVTDLSDRERSRIRNEHFGFVFQSFNLFPEFSALDNVIMPLMYAGKPSGERKKRAKELLERFGLAERMYHYPNMLSGGEQQRVAIARALANDPSLLLADEPTGNLPTEMGMDILNTLRQLNKEGLTVVMVTHDERLGSTGKRMVRLRDGMVLSDGPIEKRLDPESIIRELKAIEKDGEEQLK
ncbi:MAG: ABC transporter ATP-binding protein [Spirochaetia bacterium]